MRAVRGHDGRPLLVEVDEPPGQGELLSMRTVGICASDLGYLSHVTNGRDMQQAAEMLAARPEIADALVTHTCPLEDAAEAFRVVADRKSGAIKVVVEVG
jgi:threonine dehydrogenase-like Zn-dependent dehydrogenase